MNIIMKNGTRILRPFELKSILCSIPKDEMRDKFEALFYTGARYSEIIEIYQNPKCFLDNSILVQSSKKKAIHTERYIRLNDPGKRAVSYMLRCRKPYPTRAGWIEDLKRWATIAGIDPKGINCKTTRKTWESYLVSTYPKSLEYIFLSQGHSQLTSLKFYLMIPFTDEEKKEIIFYTDKWI
jgi:hypothetical protein